MFHLCRLRVHPRVPQVELTMYDQQNKIIGYLIVAIVAYYILQAVVPFLIIAVVGMVVWRVYELHKGR
jgi:hypothetical protein